MRKLIFNCAALSEDLRLCYNCTSIGRHKRPYQASIASFVHEKSHKSHEKSCWGIQEITEVVRVYVVVAGGESLAFQLLRLTRIAKPDDCARSESIAMFTIFN